MALVLAVEPDHRQAAILTRVIHERIHAELIVVDSRDAAMAALTARVPDVILLTTLLSPRDEDEMVAHLRTLADADHVQTHTIPQLASVRSQTTAPAASGGLLSKFRRKKEAEPITGCDPSLFAEEVRTFLARAAELKAQAGPALIPRASQPESPRPDKAQSEPPADAHVDPGSAWSSPFEWRRAEAATETVEARAEAPQAIHPPLVSATPIAVVAEQEEQRREEEDRAARARAKAEAGRERARQEAAAAAERERLRVEAEAAETERRAEAAAAAERERVRAEAAAKEEQREQEARTAAERERVAAEAAAKRERARLEAEAAAERERIRLEAVAAAERERARRAEAERARLATEAAALKEELRRDAAAAAERERLRVEAEAAAAGERVRLEAIAAAERERARLAAQAAERERARLEAEAAAREEQLRKEAEAAARRERLRLEAEAAAERERQRVETIAAAEHERAKLEAEAAAAREQQRLEAEAEAQRERRRMEAAAEERERARAAREKQAAEAAAAARAADPFADFRIGPEDAPSLLRLMPLAFWARQEQSPAALRLPASGLLAAAPPAETPADELRELMAGLSLPPQVAGVSYARGCRIRRVRVPASTAPRVQGAPPLIVSRRALAQIRAGG